MAASVRSSMLPLLLDSSAAIRFEPGLLDSDTGLDSAECFFMSSKSVCLANHQGRFKQGWELKWGSIAFDSWTMDVQNECASGLKLRSDANYPIVRLLRREKFEVSPGGS